MTVFLPDLTESKNLIVMDYDLNIIILKYSLLSNQNGYNSSD